MIKDGLGTLVNNGLAAKVVHFSFTLLPANESMPCNCGQSIHCTATQNGMHFIFYNICPADTLLFWTAAALYLDIYISN